MLSSEELATARAFYEEHRRTVLPGASYALSEADLAVSWLGHTLAHLDAITALADSAYGAGKLDAEGDYHDRLDAITAEARAVCAAWLAQDDKGLDGAMTDLCATMGMEP